MSDYSAKILDSLINLCEIVVRIELAESADEMDSRLKSAIHLAYHTLSDFDPKVRHWDNHQQDPWKELVGYRFKNPT